MEKVADENIFEWNENGIRKRMAKIKRGFFFLKNSEGEITLPAVKAYYIATTIKTAIYVMKLHKTIHTHTH